jgi:predicted DCC family thiol-disulfide oxidoreductase YuxK
VIEQRSPIKKLVLYDGVCGLCDRLVQFLLKRDVSGTLMFAPLQGPTAARLLDRHPQLHHGPESVVYIENFDSPEELAYTRSEAALRVLSALSGPWRMVKWISFVPLAVRDAGYDWIARHRYRWFGRFEACKIPTENQRHRFLP